MFGDTELSPPLRRRLLVVAGLIIVATLLLILQLWTLQRVRGDELFERGRSNRVRLRRVAATRGQVMDRMGRVLIDSRPAYEAVIVPEDAGNIEETLSNLADFLDLGEEEVEKIATRIRKSRPFIEISVAKNLGRREITRLETRRMEIPGVRLRISPQRSYPHGSVLAHVLGYVGEISEDELRESRNYQSGDATGKSGLEKLWEEALRGQHGVRKVEVNAIGRELRQLSELTATSGSTVFLTIDLDLQMAAEEELGDRAGAIVVVDVRNGEILASVSHPAHDPNLFAKGIGNADWRRLSTDPRHPLTNRVTQGTFPPGSTFKIIMAAAALEEGISTPFTRYHCNGAHRFAGRDFRCWRRRGHGSMNLHEALVNSCDVYFYQSSQKLGIDVIARYARAFGLGAPTGVPLDTDASGTIPDTAWKRLRYDTPWFPGETLSVGIGQGYVTTSPLQLAQMIAMAASGKRYRPQIIAKVVSPSGNVVRESQAELVAELPFRPAVMDQVRSALVDVVNSVGGTGSNARLDAHVVAGKTGTAQVVGLSKTEGDDEIPWHYRDHAWFVAYAPAEEPRYAISVLVEHAGKGGGTVAAPIAGKILNTAFDLEKADSFEVSEDAEHE